VDIHTQRLLPQLEVWQQNHRQLNFWNWRVELLRERGSCLKCILEFVVGIPPTAGYSCFVKNKPEVAGTLLQPLLTGYTRVKNNPDLVGTPLMAGYSCFVGDKPEIAY
jgi:hypothetical protein